MGKLINPLRIVKSVNVLYPEEIINDRPAQTIYYNTQDKNCLPNFTVIKKGGYILLDFGKEINGGLNISIQLIANAEGTPKMRVVLGESVMEALSELGEKNSSNYHSRRDMTVQAMHLSTQTYGETGFRFAKIESLNSDIEIFTVKAELQMREIEYKGSFECDDELLNEIWKTGAYTVEMNMHDYIWDGAKRDRLVWVGDMHPEVSAIRVAFGDDYSVKNSLDFATSTTPMTEWMNGFASYSMWWIVIQYDYYMHQGDFEYLKKWESHLRAIADHAAEWIDSNYSGDVEMFFIEWNSKNTESEFEGVKGMMSMGLYTASKLFGFLKDREYMEKCLFYSKKIRDEEMACKVNKRIAAVNMIANRSNDYTKELLSDKSSKDVSCFMGYYILLAKAKMGKYKEALDIIREYWGGMIKMGATTFWEDFNTEWMNNSCRIDEETEKGKNDIHGDFGAHCFEQFRHSLCHGWSSGPTPFLSEQIAGINIIEPGCRKIKLTPNLGDLNWIKVTYPTPFGSLKIEAEKTNRGTKIKVEAPSEIEIIK